MSRKLKPNSPASDCPALIYARQVLSGEVPASKWVRMSAQRHVDDIESGHLRGVWWDQEAADHVIDFCETLRHHKGRWAKKPIQLSDWQKFIVGNVFGWKVYSPNLKRWIRKYKTAWIEIPRKNGKSTFAAALALYLLYADGEGGPEIVTLATKRDQAKIVFADACEMARGSPEIMRRVKILKDILRLRNETGTIKPLSSDSKKADGLNPSGAICDEIHKWQSRELYDVIQTGIGARDEPLIINITTSGGFEESIYDELKNHGEQVLQGIIPDESFFAYIATIDDEDDWQSPEAWRKANPNWGVSVTEPTFRQDLLRLGKTTQGQNRFKRDRLCVRTSSDSVWIQDDIWQKCGVEKFSEEDLHGWECFGGLDMANIGDTASLVLAFRDGMKGGNPRYKILPWFWIPKEARTEEGSQLRQKLKAWVQEGFIFETDGNNINQTTIKNFILDCAKRFNLKMLLVDPWETDKLSQELINEGVRVEKYNQSVPSYNGPAKEWANAIYGQRLLHSGNPVLRWMNSNCLIYQDGDGKIKPTRKRSTGKIDGIMASLMALAGAMTVEEVVAEPDIYWMDD